MSADQDFRWPPEFWQIVECASDEPVSSAAAEAFAQFLAKHPEAQRQFLAHIQLQADLRLLGRSQQSLDKALARLEDEWQQPFDASKSQPSNAKCARITFAAPTPLPLTDFNGAGAANSSPWSSGIFRSSSLGWALFGIASVVCATLWMKAESHNRSNVASVKAPNPDAPSVHILSGTTKLLLPKIGYVLVDGPAEFDMLDPMRARLNRGRIKVHVTEESGHGFVVETPDGEVTDLGTTFGLDVADGQRTGLVVFDGIVDLRVGEQKSLNQIPSQRFIGGEAVVFDRAGQIDRITSITTGSTATFVRHGEVGDTSAIPIIVNVSDNLRSSQTKRFYEIVPGGFREDAVCYVDRKHEWNGITKAGLPSCLIGADYVKTFNENKLEERMEVNVTLSRPAKLFVLLDNRLPPPAWLKATFRETRDVVGSDIGPYPSSRKKKIGKGPGVSVDERFSVWELIVDQPGTVRLGPNSEYFVTHITSMYGIAATPLDPANVPVSADRKR